MYILHKELRFGLSFCAMSARHMKIGAGYQTPLHGGSQSDYGNLLRTAL